MIEMFYITSRRNAYFVKLLINFTEYTRPSTPMRSGYNKLSFCFNPHPGKCTTMVLLFYTYLTHNIMKL